MKSALILLSLGLASVAQAQEPSLSAQGTALVLRLADGKVLRGQELEGATLHLALDGGQVADVRLDSIKPDPKDAEILRHEFKVQNGDGEWRSYCEPNYYGETWGFPISLPEGHPGREGAITMTCASGAVGKCVRFGYKPWAKGPHGESLTAYHAACVHMVRADYCGDGVAHTKNGTLIDIYDTLGIQTPDSMKDREGAFEAGYDPGGAVCVARTRWPDLLTLDQLRANCPRLAQAGACTEKTARKRGALLFNRSRLKPRIGE